MLDADFQYSLLLMVFSQDHFFTSKEEVIKDVIEDALDFGDRFILALEPKEHLYVQHPVLYNKHKERHWQEENDAWHHPEGSILIAHAYLDILDACDVVQCVIVGMTGKNIQATTWGPKRLTPLE